ncbi:cyclic nucleotide-binding domain-containing protein [Bradyrhizobium erythrophlei]|uniref:cyclic nucleotide-binding domain-containing protein n=1 Tax=Bradyrhizobium erythrophlei TaxID=1437360 RepID=UPI0015593CAC|nr:cyclic nucleotide-binding domain-containing protein [Bradyrhizobium erythrophlei]
MKDLSNTAAADVAAGSSHAMLSSPNGHLFPKFSSEEIDRMRRFGETRHYAANELLFRTGKIAPAMLIIAGRVSVETRDHLGRAEKIVEMGAGEFIAEVAQLSRGPALVDARAIGPVESLAIVPARLRALLIAEVQLGERIVRALILRRVFLIESGAGGPCLMHTWPWIWMRPSLRPVRS